MKALFAVKVAYIRERGSALDLSAKSDAPQA
jgi:hypothetical protein